MRSPILIVMSAVAALVLSGIARAQPHSFESGGYRFLVDAVPTWVIPAAAPPARKANGSTAARYHLVEDQILVGEPKQRFTRRIAGAYDTAGLEQVSQITIEFNPEFETLTLHNVQVLRGEQRIDKLDPARVTMVRREKELERMIYDGVVTATIILDDVRVGDRVEYAYTLSGSNPVLGPKFSAGVPLAWSVPVDLVSVRVRTPQSRPLQVKVHRGAPQPQVRSEDGYTDISVRIDNQAAVRDEGDIPSWHVPFPWIQFSEYADWSEVAAWAQQLYQVQPTHSPALAAIVESIRAKAATPQESVQLALQLVQNDVRYLGIALGASSHRPTPPDKVFAQRFGDCKDKTMLLITLLDQLGIKAAPALVSSSLDRGLDEWLPTPHAFDHVIAAVDVGGRRFWLDGTRSYQAGRLERLGFTRFGKALVIAPETRALSDVQAPPEYRADVRIAERYSVADLRRPARLEVEALYYGERAEFMRWFLASNERPQVEKDYLNEYAARYPKIESAGPLQVEDDAAENRLRVVETYRVHDLFRYANGRLNMRVAAPVIEVYVRPPRTVNRVSPMALAYPIDIRTNAVFELPSGVPMQANTANTVRSEAFVFRITDRFADGRYSIEWEYRTLKDSIVPASVAAHVANLRKVREQLNWVMSFPVTAAQPEQHGFFERLKDAFTPGAARGAAGWEERLKAQVKLITRDIDSGKLGGAALADALHQRGTSLSLLAQNQEAERDLTRAIELDPEDAGIYLTRGELYEKLEAYDRADNDFAAAARIAPNSERLPYSRGLAYYYQGRYADAQREFQAASDQREGTDRWFAALWLYLATMRLGGDGAELLARYTDRANIEEWPGPVVEMFLGKRKPDEVIATARRAPKGVDQLRLCEGWFFVGQLHLLRGDRQSARKALQSAVDTHATLYIEYASAKKELARLK